jgi:hypothetical protein
VTAPRGEKIATCECGAKVAMSGKPSRARTVFNGYLEDV